MGSVFKTFRLFSSLILLTGAFFMFYGFASADTIVNRGIIANTHWTVKGSPYLVYETVKVSPRATLKIDPGVTVKFALGTGMDVAGKLIAHGNPDTPITFTSIYDGGPIGTAMAGDWYGLSVRGSESVLKHVRIKYAGRASFMDYPHAFSLLLNGRDIHFTNSVVEEGAGNGIWLHYYYSGLTHNNVIQKNWESGILMTHSQADLFGNTLQRNRGNGIEIDSRVNFHGNTVRWNEMNGVLLNTLEAPEIHDNDIYGNLDAGIRVEKGYPRIHHNKIHQNDVGVWIKMNWPLTIAFNDLYDNASYGIKVAAYNSKYSEVRAEKNWWGGKGGPDPFKSVSNDRASLYIDYKPWLNK